MQPLNFPGYAIQTRKGREGEVVFDPIRKIWLTLLPEEWVRQHVIRFLLDEKHFPAGLIAIEKGFQLQGRPYRADLVAYDRQGSPVVIVECKAPDIQIEQSVFDQVARYNRVIRARYIYVTNGLQHYCSKIDWAGQRYEFVDSVPDFNDL